MRISPFNNVMSGSLQKLIEPAKGWLQRYIEEAWGILLSAIDEKMIDELETQLEETIRRVNMGVSLLERCNRDWASLLKDLKGDKKVKEEKELELAVKAMMAILRSSWTLEIW